MPAFYRFGLAALIVLVGVAPTRAQERRAPEPDSVTVLELRRVPRGGDGEGRVLRRLPRDGHAWRFDGDAPMRLRAPLMDGLRKHVDTLLADRGRFRLHLDTLRNGGMAFRLNMDSLWQAHGIDSLMGEIRAFRMEEGPMRFRHEAPEARFFYREGAPGEDVRVYRDGRPRLRERRLPFRHEERLQEEHRRRLEHEDDTVLLERGRPLHRKRLPLREHGDGEVEIERDAEGRVRVYRFRTEAEDVGRTPGLRTERRVLRLGPDGTVIEGDADGVRVERDADGGLRIYVPPQKSEGERQPAPPRPRSGN